MVLSFWKLAQRKFSTSPEHPNSVSAVTSIAKIDFFKMCSSAVDARSQSTECRDDSTLEMLCQFSRPREGEERDRRPERFERLRGVHERGARRSDVINEKNVHVAYIVVMRDLKCALDIFYALIT